jgi:molybdopterin molybdotransferase
MGDTDHVPAAVRNCGAEIVFHRLAIRPGAPILGAVAPPGKLVLGLPGNPVSVAVTFRRFGLPMLGRIAGSSQQPKRFPVELANPDDKTLHLVWYRLVQMQADGRALLLPNQGSGDLRTLGLSDGFIEIPNQTESRGTFRYYDWSHS